jgi:protein phosphatase
MICDDVTNQQVNRDTFDLLYYILRKRMYLGRFTVADSTALHSEARRQLRELAQRYGYFTCLLLFDVPEEVCLRRDRQRERRVGDAVIAYHAGLLKQALVDAPQEGWHKVHVLHEEDMNAVVSVI